MLSDSVLARRTYQPRPRARPAAGGAAAAAACPSDGNSSELPSLNVYPEDGGENKTWVSFQPPFHTMDRKSVWAQIFTGGRVAIHQDDQGKETLWEDFMEAKPERIVASPAFWKQLHTEFQMAGSTPEAAAEILRKLGGNVKSGNISGAKPSAALLHFMKDDLKFGKPPGDNYSSTEAHLVLKNGEVDTRNGVQVKLIDVPGMYHVAEQKTGELVVNSPTMFSGYYNNKSATGEAFLNDLLVETQGGGFFCGPTHGAPQRWYMTGDVARVKTVQDAETGEEKIVFGRDGKTPVYEIVDRVSSIVKMANGEFVNPSRIEEKLMNNPKVSALFEELIVVAEPGKQQVAGIAVRKEEFKDTVSDDELLGRFFQNYLRPATPSDNFAPPERVKGFVFVEAEDFATWKDQGLLTPLGKVVRGAVAKKFAKELSQIHNPGGASGIFKFAKECQYLLKAADSNQRVVGLISLILEANPEVVARHEGHLGLLGMNSLQAAQLSATLKNDASFNNREVSSAKLLTMDLKAVVDCVVTGNCGMDEAAQAELLAAMDADSKLPEELEAIIKKQRGEVEETIAKEREEEGGDKSSDSIKPDPIKTVFVTGGNGILGSAIIADILVNYPQVEKIYALVRGKSVEKAMNDKLAPAIRGAMVNDPEQRSPKNTMAGRRSATIAKLNELKSLKQNWFDKAFNEKLLPKVIAIVGNLHEENFGMEDAKFQALGSEVDVIIHCAAVVNHVLPYSGHKEANVVGTQRILELAVAGGKNSAVHFVSTSNVVLASKPTDVIREDAELKLTPEAASNLYGYAQSKLVSELLVRNASEAGLPVAVYRPGIISSHTISGYCKLQDFYPRLLQAIMKHGKYPEIDEKATFDMTPLDYVSRGITDLSMRQTAKQIVDWNNRSGFGVEKRTYHTISKDTHEVPFKTLVDGVGLFMETGLFSTETEDRELKQIKYEDFEKEMQEEPDFAPLLHELRAGGRTRVRWLGTENFATSVGSPLEAGLPIMPNPVVDAGVVERCLNYCKYCEGILETTVCQINRCQE